MVLSQLSQAAYRNLTETCKSPATRKIYIKSLGYFMQFLKLDKEQYDKLLEKDHKLIQGDIIDFISYMKSKECSSALK
jgi:hypothetical protein